MTKKRRTYLPRIVGDKVMMPTDLKRREVGWFTSSRGRPCRLGVSRADHA
jgi:hypothetical protein